MKLYAPSKIPLSYFYFGYKKAKHFVTKEASFCDYYDLELFESNLDKNIKKLKEEFENYSDLSNGLIPLDSVGKRYKLNEAIIYWIPKSWENDKSPRMRPKGVFSFKDQVAWATVVLALSEWFDTNIKTRELISLDKYEQREALEWMVSWSYNNRIKRIHKYNEINNEYERGLVHYNGSSLYESYQWGMHQRNTAIKSKAKEIIDRHGTVYMGQTDIQEFYPTLKLEYIKDVLMDRLKELRKNNVILEDSELNEWDLLLSDLLDFRFEFVDLDYMDVDMLDKFARKISQAPEDSKLSIKEKVINSLKQTLPLDIISAGFLSNCALTEILDKKIESFIQNQSIDKHKQTFIFRYTDDITILSPDEDFIRKILKEIKSLLGNKELVLSEEKTRPLINEEKKIIELKEKNKKLASIDNNIFKDILNEIEPQFKAEKFEKDDNLPGSTAIIEKMSQISDIELLTLDDNEIEEYIKELLNLLDMKFDNSEIEDETKVTFISWRIRSGLYEHLQRSLDTDKYNVKTPLIKAIEKYPYKISLYEIYTLILIDRISKTRDEVSIEYLEDFLKFLNGSEQTKYKSQYFPFIRTKLLFLISREWKRIPNESRGKLRLIISDSVQNWYAFNKHIRWHEKYAIYYAFSVLKIKTDPKFAPVNVKSGISVLNSLNRLRVVYSLSNDFYYSNEEKALENKGTSAFTIDEIQFGDILLFQSLFKQGLYYSKYRRKNEWSNFEEALYPTIFDLLKEEKLDVSPEEKEILWFKLSQIDVQRISKTGWEFLDSVKVHNKIISDNILLIVTVVHKAIQSYFSNPKKMCNFARWIKEGNNKDSFFKNYVNERFLYYSIIQRNFIGDTTNNIQFPIDFSNLLKETTSNKVIGKLNIPIADWLFYIKNTPSMKLIELYPLSEYEKVYLFSKILSKINEELGNIKEEDEFKSLSHAYLYNYGISIEKWTELRKGIISSNTPSKNNETKEENLIGKCDNKLNIKFQYPGVDIIKKSYNEKHTRNTHISHYLKSITLLSILEENAFELTILKPFYIYNWKDLQTVFHQANFPSTDIATLLVNTLNGHRRFYEEHYRSFDYAALPYRKVGTNTVDSEDSYKKTINQILDRTNKNNKFISKSIGVIEVIEIDLDVIK